jgi:hypothetical protein
MYWNVLGHPSYSLDPFMCDLQAFYPFDKVRNGHRYRSEEDGGGGVGVGAAQWFHQTAQSAFGIYLFIMTVAVQKLQLDMSNSNNLT